MPWSRPPTDGRSSEELRRHYVIERSLARELCSATRAERGSLYGEVYDRLFRQVPELSQRADVGARDREVQLQVQALAPFLDRDTVFLEIGAGDCALALQLAARVGHVYAIEASAEVTRNVRPQENLDLIVTGETRLGLAADSVDVAYSCHFLEHLHPDDAGDHAVEVRRVLRSQGCYICVTPHRLWGPHDISRYFDDSPHGLHLKEYGYRDLIRLLRGAGFRRFAVLRGVGRPPKTVATGPHLVLEAALDLIPGRPRRWLMTRALAARSRPPFRPLEQVALVALT